MFIYIAPKQSPQGTLIYKEGMSISHLCDICVPFECLEASQQNVKSTRLKVNPERVALLVLSALLAAAVVALCVTSECAQFSD